MRNDVEGAPDQPLPLVRPDCAPRLQGAFGAVILDEPRKRLLLIKGRLLILELWQQQYD